MNRTTRRSFLQIGSAGLLGLGLSDWLRLEASGGENKSPSPKATGMILIWLGGGPATIDMWDPKPEAPAEYRGEFGTIGTAIPGVRLSEPLQRTAGILEKCVLIRSLSHGLPVHDPATRYMMTGNLPSPARNSSSLGSITARSLPSRKGMPAYVTLNRIEGEGAGDLGPAWNPFEIPPSQLASEQSLPGVSLPDSLPIAEFERRNQLRQVFDASFGPPDSQSAAAGLLGFQEQAVDILRSDRIGRALDVTQEPEATRDLYGRTALAQNALRACRLIEAGARFVTVGMTGFDTHSDNFNTLRNRLLPAVDQTLAALITDLDQRGLLETTLICCVGEFARTPRVNNQAGRDHWSRSMAALLAGGGLKRGEVYGATDKRGLAPITSPHTPGDLAATLLYCLTGQEKLTVDLPSGRNILAIQNGKAISSLKA
jgi:hypothetical protein